MNILQISSQVPVPETDGGKISIFGITKILKRMGHKIDFLCYLKDADYEKSVKLMKNYCEPYLIKVDTKNNIVDAVKNIFSKIPYNASKYRKKELREYVKLLLRKKKYDIIQIEHLHMGWIIDYIKTVSPNIPVILREQNLELKIMERYYKEEKNIFLKLFAYIQYMKFLKFEPEMCAKFDLCIMISETDKNELLKLNPEINVISIPAGVDDKLLKYPMRNNLGEKIIHIGNLNWYPNRDGLNWYMKEVLPNLVKVFPKIKLFIYGGGDFSKIEVPSDIKNNIEVVGFVDDLWKNLNDKSLAIVPLRIGGGIRIKILEMLAYGINVLSTSIGKEGIALEDGVQILIANSSNEFIKKSVDYFNNVYDNKKIINNGRSFIANNYTWEIIGRKFEDSYNELLNRANKNYT